MSYRSRRYNAPLVPGEKCTAERNNSAFDKKVTVTETGRHYRKGTRTCGRCGREKVPVQQSYGERLSAWYYSDHTVPEKEQK